MSHVYDVFTFLSVVLFMSKQAQTHLPLDQVFQMLPVSLWDPRLLFLPAALEVQASHKCLRHPMKQQQGLRYISYYWDLEKK